MHRIFKKFRAIYAVLSFISIPTLVFGQTYQRARDALPGSVIQEVYIYENPDISSRKVTRIPKGSAILVFGKRGAFLDVKYRTFRGWLSANYFSMDQPSQSSSEQAVEQPTRSQPVAPAQSSPVIQQSAPQQLTPTTSSKTRITTSVVRRPSSQPASNVLPIRLNPYLSLSYAGKSFDNQLRIGFAGTAATSKNVSVGGVIDMVFIKGTYFDIGPIIRNQWNYNSYLFNPAFYAGFLFYTFDHDGDSDKGFGFQTALENDVMIYRDKSFQPSINLKAGMDLMYFGFEQVRIPFWFAAGATFRF